MLTYDLPHILARHSSSSPVEFTTETATDAFAESICALANDFSGHRQPGHLIIGVDSTGTVSGMKVSDTFVQEIRSLPSNIDLEPSPVMTVQKFTLPEGEVAVVEVQPSNRPPVRYKDRVWIHAGLFRRIANQQEVSFLTDKRVHHQRNFDGIPCTGCTITDIDTELFRFAYSRAVGAPAGITDNNQTMEERMASRHLYDLRADCPTNAGVLLFGRDPLRWIPGAWMQFNRWEETAMAESLVEEKRFSGALIAVLGQLEAYVRSLLRRARPLTRAVLRKPTEIEYPLVAVWQLLMNAIMHRSYEVGAPIRWEWHADRMEIHSPGGLFGAASPENFPQMGDYRNPVLARNLTTLGHARTIGLGVIHAQEALRKNDFPEAEFKFESSHVLTTIRKKE